MADRYIDITGDSCPMTFVKAKLELEKLLPDQVLEVLLKGREPLENVPRSAVESGYKILSSVDHGDGTHTMMIAR